MIQPFSAQCGSHNSCWELELFDMNKPLWWTDFWSVPGVMDGWGWGRQWSTQVSTSSRVCISFSLPSNLYLHCERITLSSLSSLLEVKIRQAWHNLALRSFPLREVKSPQLSKICWRLHDCFMHPSGKHWDALRIDADKDEKMKAANHWMTSSLCWMQWQNNQV